TSLRHSDPRNGWARRVTVSLALSFPVLALVVPAAARADTSATVFKLSVTGRLTGLPYTITIKAERGSVRSFSVILTRGTKVQQVHRFEFSPADVDFGIAASLSRAHLDTRRAMGRFGRIDV